MQTLSSGSRAGKCLNSIFDWQNAYKYFRKYSKTLMLQHKCQAVIVLALALPCPNEISVLLFRAKRQFNYSMKTYIWYTIELHIKFKSDVYLFLWWGNQQRQLQCGFTEQCNWICIFNWWQFANSLLSTNMCAFLSYCLCVCLCVGVCRTNH